MTVVVDLVGSTEGWGPALASKTPTSTSFSPSRRRVHSTPRRSTGRDAPSTRNERTQPASGSLSRAFAASVIDRISGSSRMNRLPDPVAGLSVTLSVNWGGVAKEGAVQGGVGLGTRLCWRARCVPASLAVQSPSSDGVRGPEPCELTVFEAVLSLGLGGLPVSVTAGGRNPGRPPSAPLLVRWVLTPASGRPHNPNYVRKSYS